MAKKTIGIKIKDFRKKNNLTQDALAKSLGYYDKSVKGISSLILDFKKVDYISSAGLRVLLVTYRTMAKQGSMIIRNANKNVMDIFTMTGFDNILTIE